MCLQAGKYASVIVQQWLFVWWRNKGNHDSGASFIIWVIFATISAIYTCSWVSIATNIPHVRSISFPSQDFVIDWSLFRPNAGLLRKDLGYSRRYVSLNFEVHLTILLTLLEGVLLCHGFQLLDSIHLHLVCFLTFARRTIQQY